MNAIGKTLDLKIEWTEEVGWGNIGEGLKAGRYDMACVSMWPDAPKYKTFFDPSFVLQRDLFMGSCGR